MSFKHSFEQFFESQQSFSKYGTDENGQYHPVADGIVPNRDGFLPGFLPEIWGQDEDTRLRQLTLSRYDLTSLKNCTKIVLNNFMVSHNLITNLIGGPKKVQLSYFASFNPELSSLEGFPEYVGGDFTVSQCPKLPLLELARVDAGNKVNGRIFWDVSEPGQVLPPIEKTKCTRAYYDLVKHTAQGEQEEIGEI